MKLSLTIPALLAATFLSACSENTSEPLAEAGSCIIPPKLDIRSSSQIPIFRSYHQRAVKKKIAKIDKKVAAGKNSLAEINVLVGFKTLGTLSASEAATWCNYEIYNKNKCQNKGVRADKSGQELSYTASTQNTVRRKTRFSDPNYSIVETKSYGPKGSKQFMSKVEYRKIGDGGVEYTNEKSDGFYKAYKEDKDCSGEFTSYRDTGQGRQKLIRAKWTSTQNSDFKIEYTYCEKPGQCVSGIL